MDADEEHVHFWGKEETMIDSMEEDSKYTRQQQSKNGDKAIGNKYYPAARNCKCGTHTSGRTDHTIIKSMGCGNGKKHCTRRIE
jgi:hypothetical protein